MASFCRQVGSVLRSLCAPTACVGRGHCRDSNGRAEALGQVTACFGCAACQNGVAETLPSVKKII